MKAMIGRVFARNDAPPGRRSRHSVSSELTTSDIESYYLHIIGNCLQRMMVALDSVEIRIRRTGTRSNGLASYAGCVRILSWDPVMTPVLLQNMAVIDARIRKVVAASVLLEHTHFAGLWFQATAKTHNAPQVLIGMPAELVVQAGTAAPAPSVAAAAPAPVAASQSADAGGP
jgi:hypothetical protein